MNDVPEISGASDVVSWFGHWPSFHDAEIISLHLNRSGPSTLVLYAWNMTDKVDASGHYVLEKHALVTFTLLGIADLELADFSGQNVIGSLVIERQDKRFRIKLSPCYGLCGTLDADSVNVSVQPGRPDKANHTSDGIRQPANGSPRPSM
jgi:hypothetical protein